MSDPEVRAVRPEPDDTRTAILSRYQEAVRSPSYAGQLRAAYKRAMQQHQFTPGTLVQWKSGMRNRRFPTYGAPMVVVRDADPSARDPSKMSSAGPIEDPDIVCAVLVGEDRFVLYSFESWRLQPFDEDSSLTAKQ